MAYTEVPTQLEGVEIRDFYGIKDAVRYQERIKKVAGADGIQADGQYDYRYDAARFCKKTFAQDAVFDEDELVFWFDADCVIKKDIPESVLAGMLEGVALAYMGRGREKSYAAYTETGFVGFNTKHEDFPVFRSRYLSFFTTGKIFQQIIGWHDCIAFDEARKGLRTRNISPRGKGMQPVIQDTVIGEYVDQDRKSVV